MTGVPLQPGAPAVRLALPPGPGTGGRPARLRRGALGLALLALSALSGLVANGTIRLPGSGPAAPGPGGDAPARAGAGGAEAARERAPGRAAPPAPERRPAAGRVVPPQHAVALFARHSWYVPPKPPPPPPPPPPPQPKAPPFPYSFVGSFAPAGDAPVFFLKKGDRVVDAHVGDRLDGVYQFESAAGGQLVFTYLPLHFRQTLAVGASP